MKELNYTTEEQFVNDVAVAIIEEHLLWSNSNERKPGERNVYSYRCTSAVYSAIFAAFMTDEAWKYMDEEARAEFVDHTEKKAYETVEKALEIADAKWAAAMTLLGL